MLDKLTTFLTSLQQAKVVGEKPKLRVIDCQWVLAAFSKTNGAHAVVELRTGSKKDVLLYHRSMFVKFTENQGHIFFVYYFPASRFNRLRKKYNNEQLFNRILRLKRIEQRKLKYGGTS